MPNFNIVNKPSFVHMCSVDFAILLAYGFRLHTAITITLNHSHLFSAVLSLDQMFPVWTSSVYYIMCKHWFIFKLSKVTFSQTRLTYSKLQRFNFPTKATHHLQIKFYRDLSCLLNCCLPMFKTCFGSQSLYIVISWVNKMTFCM